MRTTAKIMHFGPCNRFSPRPRRNGTKTLQTTQLSSKIQKIVLFDKYCDVWRCFFLHSTSVVLFLDFSEKMPIIMSGHKPSKNKDKLFGCMGNGPILNIMLENDLNMIDLVLTHLTHPWGPPWTLATLGNPWRPLATCLKMPENGQNDHFQACRQWSPRNSCRCFWQLFDFLSRTIGSVMLLDTWKHMSQKKKSYSLSLRVLVPRHQNSGAPNVTDGLVKGSCPHLLLMRLTHC